MVSEQDWAALIIRHVIFHDVPNSPRGTVREPILADAVTEIDARRSSVLKTRLARALGSKSAYDIQFDPDTGSPVPAELARYTDKPHQLKTFVEMSRKFAKYLAEQQGGNTSPGLLCVVDAETMKRPAIAILKLERERGVEIELQKEGGKQTFSMAVLENLVFTDGTRLFKSALFIRTSNGKFRAAACDSQRTVATSTEMARFWLRFLGCRFAEHPRVTTQKWFDATVRFLNDHVSDPVAKNDLHEALQAELKSQKQTISPQKFGESYVSDAYRESYLAFLRENEISLRNFEKDISDIQNKLRRHLFHTSRGVTVTVPAEEKGLVKIEPEQIVVNDQLDRVS